MARAFAGGRPVADTEAARPVAGHPGDHSRLGGGFHSVHAVPLSAGASPRTGCRRCSRHPGHRLSPVQHTGGAGLAGGGE
ncbi:hypothetical protein [Actinacidiphila acidipaludis]|uniref:Uncharacterized protein n=1 Tax=Actinacidiphila acidipaludis TaxID=2873382 RepID=A0ABS7QJ13_9ACTN|nr:hypothetical protein [Streptomyces acidipaludis]MBY8882405.1 hypothetical protein [Streptomyces acidipaludis]